MIKLKSIKKIYNSTNEEVLNNINLVIPSGKITIFTGESGSGKSSLLKIMACLDLDYSGILEIDDIIINQDDEKLVSNIRKEKIGYIFQDFKLLDKYTILQNLKIILRMSETKALTKKEEIDLIEESLRVVNLNLDVLLRFPYQLSGGQKQRIAIARALLKSPVIIFGDEITAALDEKNTYEIMKILSELAKKGITIIIATHDEKIIPYADLIINIKDKMAYEYKKQTNNYSLLSKK